MILPSYYVYRLLPKDSLKYIQDLLKNETWADGLRTTKRMTSEIKRNEELLPTMNTKLASKAIYANLENVEEFTRFALPALSSEVIFSKMTKGGYYRTHHDAGYSGQLSTTLFLNDPSKYEGGELRLWINGEYKDFKLEAGHAVSYSTGLPHEVRPVEKGERKVAVFWTHSRIRDPLHRDLFYASSLAASLLEKTHNPQDGLRDPYFLVSYLHEQILRLYGQG